MIVGEWPIVLTFQDVRTPTRLTASSGTGVGGAAVPDMPDGMGQEWCAAFLTLGSCLAATRTA